MTARAEARQSMIILEPESFAYWMMALVSIYLHRHKSDIRRLALVAAFVCPMPIASLSSGMASAVYMADVLAPFVLIYYRRDLAGCLRCVSAIAVCIILWPYVATLVSVLAYEARADYNLAALATMRASTFCGACALGSRITSDWQRTEVLRFLRTIATMVLATSMFQYVMQVDMDYWNRVRDLSVYEYRSLGIGGGVLGLYRGGVGVLAALCVLVSVVTMRHERGYLRMLPWLGIASAVSASVLTGSRQGMILAGLAFVLAGLTNVTSLVSPKVALMGVAVATVAGVAGASLLPVEVREWVDERFSISNNRSLLDVRDNRLIPVLDNTYACPHRYILGLGFVPVSESFEGEKPTITYVDSDIMWSIQKIGYLGTLTFSIWLTLIIGSGWRRSSLILPLVGVGVAFSVGHFFFLHVEASNAVTGSMIWMMVGLEVRSAHARHGGGEAA